jgi:RNA polymerase-binding transcription factor DksA
MGRAVGEGTLRSMQNEWSIARDDGDDGGLAEFARKDPSIGTEREPEQQVAPTILSTDPVAATDTDWSAGPEGASEAEEQAHRSAVDAVDELLDEVERSLGRLDDGTYGRCDECGSVIDDTRLAESPIVRTCGSCGIGGLSEASELPLSDDGVLATAVAGPIDLIVTTDPFRH